MRSKLCDNKGNQLRGEIRKSELSKETLLSTEEKLSLQIEMETMTCLTTSYKGIPFL